MKQFRTLIIAVLSVLAMLGMRSAAYANTITIGSSTSGTITFTSTGTGDVTVSSTTLLGNALFTGGATGSYSFSPMSFTAGPNSSEKYPAGVNSDTFTFSDRTNTLDGTVTWSFIQDNTTNPKFFGTLDVTTISGTAAFLSTFGGVGSMDAIDLITTALSSGGTLDNLASSAVGTRATAGISSGEITGGATPEPSSMMLFGLGVVLIGLCALPRRRFSVEA